MEESESELYGKIKAWLSWEYPNASLTKIPLKVSVTELGGRAPSARSRVDSADGEPQLVAEDMPDGEQQPIAEDMPEGTGSICQGESLGNKELISPSQPGLRATLALDTPEFLSASRGFTRAQVGTFTHLALEKADFAAINGQDDLDALLRALASRGIMTRRQAGAVDCGAILRFLASDIGRLARSAREMHKETVFTVKLSLAEYAAYANCAQASAVRNVGSADEPFVLLQGSIDCWFVAEDGSVILVDYKTGFRMPAGAGMQSSQTIPAGAGMPQSYIPDKYRRQVELYALALEKMYGRGPDRKYICLLSSGASIKV
jgi:ATP-dependent exoDNAse (exonuclease V) beta subunit